MTVYLTDYTGLLQWPAMFVTVIGAWFIGLRPLSRRPKPNDARPMRNGPF